MGTPPPQSLHPLLPNHTLPPNPRTAAAPSPAVEGGMVCSPIQNNLCIDYVQKNLFYNKGCT